MGEADEIRELAERLLTHLIPGNAVPTITLLPGRTPDDPDLSVPSPPGARVIGSLIREPGWQLPRDIEVVLDAPGYEEQMLRFYEEQFGQRGWRVAPQFGHRPGGFMAGPEGEGRMFRRGEDDGVAILLTARPVKAGWVEVRLRTQWIPPEAAFHQAPPGQDLIPALRQPAGVHVVNASGSGGGASWMSEAVVETAKAVSELEAHFASQLEKAGWKKRAGGAAGPLAWSSWTVPGEGEWHGYLFVVEAPGENRRSLWVRLESRRQYGGRWHAATSALSSG